jgi:hypothetical protein
MSQFHLFRCHRQQRRFWDEDWHPQGMNLLFSIFGSHEDKAPPTERDRVMLAKCKGRDHHDER